MNDLEVDKDFETYFHSLPNRSTKILVPAYERIKQLYSFGYSTLQMLDTITSEFGDSLMNPLTIKDIESIVNANLDAFKHARMQIGRKCGEELARQAANLYKITHKAESRLVSVYAEKMAKATDQLAELDLDERDEDGYYVNTKRIFILIELIDKLQSKIAKIAGTDAMREIEITKQKLKLKLQYMPNGGGLLPDPIETEVQEESIPRTKFL